MYCSAWMSSDPPASRRRRLAEAASALKRRFPSALGAGGDPLPMESTGVPALDRMLPGGGFPRGRLSVLYGPPSSGRAGLTLSAAARLTQGGRLVGWIDGPGDFHPPSAASAGLDISRVLLVRPPPSEPAEALHAAVLLLRTSALPLLVLDITGDDPGRSGRRYQGVFPRLRRSVPSSSVCLVLSGAKPPEDLLRLATIAIRLERDSRKHLGAASPGGINVTATLARSRLGGERQRCNMSLPSSRVSVR